MTDYVADTAAWTAVFVAFLSVIVYAIQAWFNRKQVKASLDQVKVSHEQMSVSQQQLWVSQDQVKISMEQTYAMGRPLLFPFGPEESVGPSKDVIYIRNAGPGTALNIRGVVFGHKLTNPDEKDSFLRKLWFANPLPPGDHHVEALNLGGRPKFRGDCEIGNQHRTCIFYAPERTLEELNKGMAPIVQRLTLTYHDIFGLKHASIFDRSYPQSWEFVAFLKEIPKDIDDLEHEAG